MKPPTAVIAEDEPHLREELRESLVALWPQLEIVGEAENGIEALRLLNSASPDILFLDIQMPDINGIEFSRIINKKNTAVVFTTAFSEYAVEG